ncbi:response regulator [Aquabacterium sp. CECT 9606]|uniref:hybrid sensor histidine kinase/response regulator n=1 Tax=Aquabacterium sp. CECT 9606 TaxID=2845822 RepID=UPI001E2ACCBD|nr:response regulator [Aquabacterium sp. CECT 9606]CAH0348297.1 Sensor histidine kinase RcsC [Aquabacterium sp. CECT 9606]
MFVNDPANILIVDDLPEKLLVFRTVLEDLGQNLVFVRSGSEALKEVLKTEFAVILLDVNMPDIDGLETAQLIRKYKRSAHTPIIFITAYADEMQTSRGYSLGAVDYILSPVIPEVLRSKVKVFVELHNMQRRARRQAEERVALAAAEAARKVAEDNTQRSNFLSQASRVLSESLDVGVGMHQLLELLVPSLTTAASLTVLDQAMSCTFDLVTQGRTFQNHAQGELPEAIQQAVDQATSQLRRVAITAPWPGMAVPLVIGSRVLGVLMVATDHDQEGAMLQELSSRAAMAFENARLYKTLEAEIVERRQAETLLQQSSQRKDEFLAMLSHELRNPLAPIRNAIEVIRRVAPPDATLQWANDVMDRQINHLTRLVEELLDVARINQGSIVLQSEPVDLRVVIAQSVETIRPLITAKGHALSLDISATPVWMRGDFARLLQIVSNLLNNAAKYTEDGGTIHVSLTAQHGQAIISVKDNGIGIEADLLPNVFDLFKQGKRSLARSQGGLGVGLTLVQRLVQLHHGQIQALSRGPGLGAEFRVTMACLVDITAQSSMSSPPAEASKAASGCRVLVVDDNVDAAESIAMFLALVGHDVKTAGDGPQALSCAPAFQPDVVVLDIGLPGLDGYEVARRLRQLPQTQQALIIALTGYGQQSDQAQAREAGFDEHLVKPADPEALIKVIAKRQQALALRQSNTA